ncbi:M23 family metallopeptidase [Alcaligenaceae bacterium LF4-65]|uniref:M23 family metallopeptidase n=1 Tax=Zwartia hollandica TaxID=324606 RepID=A0A953NAD9_9BURK|nr:M23 family metallopeptidase [Zwartia hollandica]
MPSRQGQYAPITLSVSRLVVLVALLLVAAMIAGAVLQRLVWKLQPETQPSALVVAAMAPSPSASVAADNQTVHLLATKVGELQATIKRLDGLGRRVAKVAGLPDGDVSVASETPEAAVVLDDLWVPLPPGPHVRPLSELESQINAVQARLTRQSDYFSMLDLAVTERAATVARLPTAMPIESYPYLSSSYGWRRNPFNGQMSMHEGLDFSAPEGTPIRAASGGVVRTVAQHRGFGNMVEIDHGEGLITRYAHAKVVLVKEGQLVTRGQLIARVGSTGLSTGPHLHFEVRQDDRPLDPRVFLAGQPMVAEQSLAQPVSVGTSGVTWRPRLR